MQFIVRKQKFLFSKNRETTVTNHHDNFISPVEYEAVFASQIPAITVTSYLSPCQSPPSPIPAGAWELPVAATLGLCDPVRAGHQPRPPGHTLAVYLHPTSLICQQPPLLCAHSKTQ